MDVGMLWMNREQNTVRTFVKKKNIALIGCSGQLEPQHWFSKLSPQQPKQIAGVHLFDWSELSSEEGIKQ
jgi:hypothetical protein